MRLLLVDGHYYLYRSFYGIRELRNSRGEPTNAIVGFTKSLRKMLAELKPDRAAVIWDRGLPARRVELLPTYKHNRAPMPDDLRPQEDWLQKNIPLFGVASLFLQNIEADDLIASYLTRAVGDGAEVIVATSDKDIFQMVSDSVRIYSPSKESPEGFVLLGVPEVTTKWGVAPELIADILALVGDASDNIPGIPGIGPKTALALIQSAGSLNALIEDPLSIPNLKLREKIRSSIQNIRFNRELVRLDTDIPLPTPWTDLTITPNVPLLLSALREREIRSLAKDIEAETSSKTLQQELF